MRPRTRNFSANASFNPQIQGRPAGGQVIGKRSKRKPALAWITFFMFMTLIAFFIPPDLADTASIAKDFGAPSATLRTIKFILLGISLGIIGSNFKLSVAMLKAVNRLFVAFLILIPLSIFWSIEPSATIARYVSLMTVVLVCFAVALVDPGRTRLQQVLRPILTLFLLGSLIVGIMWPEMVLEKGNDVSLKDAWHGLASQKNEFGQLSSLGVILWVHAAVTRQSKWILVLIGGGAAAACVLLSRSSTALLATAFACFLLLLLQRPPPALQRYMPYMVGTFTVLVLTYAIAALNLVPGLGVLFAPFTAMSGKDMTFSNRATIWAIIKEHIQLSPLLGSGYGAYWVGPLPSSPSSVFLTRMWLYPTQSHNGFLEVTNDLGFVGLICLLGYLITYIRQSIVLMRVDRKQAALFIAIIFQQVIINLSEACWMTARSASSNITILATICLGRLILEAKNQTPPPPDIPVASGARMQRVGRR